MDSGRWGRKVHSTGPQGHRSRHLALPAQSPGGPAQGERLAAGQAAAVTSPSPVSDGNQGVRVADGFAVGVRVGGTPVTENCSDTIHRSP